MTSYPPLISLYPLPTTEWLTYFAGKNFPSKNKLILTDNILHPDLDCLYVFDSLPTTIATTARNIIYLSGETAWTYDDVSQSFFIDFFQQFDQVFTPLPVYLDNVQSDYPFLVPMVGGSHADYMNNPLCSYDQLQNLTPTLKHRKPLISVFQSSQKWKEGHRRRHDIISHIHKRFGDSIDIYGSTYNTAPSKYAALSQYKYHIAIENQCSPLTVTEKLIDPILSYTLPIYSGGSPPSIFNGSFLPLDISSLDTVFTSIETILQTDPYDEFLDAICRSRQAVLCEFNVFSRIEKITLTYSAKPHHRTDPPLLRTLHPLNTFYKQYQARQTIVSRLKNRLFK